MTILALDTSGKIASCTLLRRGEAPATLCQDSMRDHSSTLLSLCRRLLRDACVSVGDVDLFAAAVGPGSFTGVRIGTAAVKGFGWTQNKPCAAVSSLLAMAWQHKRDGVVCCRITALNDEYYYAFFRRGHGAITRITQDAAALSGDIAAEAEALGCDTVLTDTQSSYGTALAAVYMAENGEVGDCHSVEPVYLKKPQAERLREEKLKG